MVAEDDAYQRSQRQALVILDEGFHMGGQPLPPRDELHER
jgi:hypothetical protein